ncbi:DUF2000 domain-containing protein [Streptomyces sp. ISL-96]|uniref:DUF2000 domain-containing protein n=1 Tax=Streptomyces sp. ISL-96 TaxID=2819191 RepID=UPI001BE8491A|nr:DUF2000 domain-containing protein [Streptomyces sp. ISL-96]MBT2488323.1 DUF2000 domain-containing protein [Streptomyces sp. ISL-96]
MRTKEETKAAAGVGTGAGAGTAAGDAQVPVRFDTKIAVLLRDDLEPWARLNVTAFVVSGLGTASAEVIGEPYADADDTPYLPMFRQPVLVFEGTKEMLTAAHSRALSRSLLTAVFTSDLFSTGGPRNAVDKVLKGARMHP